MDTVQDCVANLKQEPENRLFSEDDHDVKHYLGVIQEALEIIDINVSDTNQACKDALKQTEDTRIRIDHLSHKLRRVYDQVALHSEYTESVASHMRRLRLQNQRFAPISVNDPHYCNENFESVVVGLQLAEALATMGTLMRKARLIHHHWLKSRRRMEESQAEAGTAVQEHKTYVGQFRALEDERERVYKLCEVDRAEIESAKEMESDEQ